MSRYSESVTANWSCSDLSDRPALFIKFWCEEFPMDIARNHLKIIGSASRTTSRGIRLHRYVNRGFILTFGKYLSTKHNEPLKEQSHNGGGEQACESLVNKSRRQTPPISTAQLYILHTEFQRKLRKVNYRSCRCEARFILSGGPLDPG